MNRFRFVGLLLLVGLAASLFEIGDASTLTYSDSVWSSILVSGPDAARPGETVTLTLYGKTGVAANASLSIRVRCDTSTAPGVVILEDNALAYGSYPQGQVVSKTYEIGLPTNAVNRHYVYVDVNTSVSYFYGFPVTLVEDPRYADLQFNVTTLQSNVTSLQVQIAQLTANITSLQSTISTLQAEKAGLQSQVASLQAQISQLTTNNTNLQSRINTLEAEKTALQSQVASLQTQVTSLQSQVTALTGEKASLQSQVSYLQSQVNTLQSDVNTLQSRVYSLESQVTTGTTIQILLAGVAVTLLLSTVYFAREKIQRAAQNRGTKTGLDTQ